jgi:hypothetical protein
MFDHFRRFVELEGQDLWPGIGPEQMGLGQPGQFDASGADTKSLWGDSGPVGVGVPGSFDATSVPAGDLWGDTSDTLPY